MNNIKPIFIFAVSVSLSIIFTNNKQKITTNNDNNSNTSIITNNNDDNDTKSIKELKIKDNKLEKPKKEMNQSVNSYSRHVIICYDHSNWSKRIENDEFCNSLNKSINEHKDESMIIKLTACEYHKQGGGDDTNNNIFNIIVFPVSILILNQFYYL
jgi:hypothetical protein